MRSTLTALALGLILVSSASPSLSEGRSKTLKKDKDPADVASVMPDAGAPLVLGPGGHALHRNSFRRKIGAFFGHKSKSTARFAAPSSGSPEVTKVVTRVGPSGGTPDLGKTGARVGDPGDPAKYKVGFGSLGHGRSEFFRFGEMKGSRSADRRFGEIGEHRRDGLRFGEVTDKRGGDRRFGDFKLARWDDRKFDDVDGDSKKDGRAGDSFRRDRNDRWPFADRGRGDRDRRDEDRRHAFHSLKVAFWHMKDPCCPGNRCDIRKGRDDDDDWGRGRGDRDGERVAFNEFGAGKGDYRPEKGGYGPDKDRCNSRR